MAYLLIQSSSYLLLGMTISVDLLFLGRLMLLDDVPTSFLLIQQR